MNHTPLPTIDLSPRGRSTTTLGFGCSGITGGLGRRQSLRLLEAAFDAGIRHFDVAPMYGFGTAEDVVGEFAFRHAGWITLTTKYGIAPPASGWLLNTARTVVRPAANLLPALRAKLIKRAGNLAHPAAKPAFTPAKAMQSLEASLRKLQVDRLDVFLLHEADEVDLQDEKLLRALHDARDAGKIAAFGVGSPSSTVDRLLQTHPEYCAVVQHEWSAVAQQLPATDAFHICHRTIAGAAPVIQQWLSQDAALRQEWMEKIDVDIADPEILAALLLKGSLALTPGIVLFSSRQPSRIKQNVEYATNQALVAPAMRLYNIVHLHRQQAPLPVTRCTSTAASPERLHLHKVAFAESAANRVEVTGVGYRR